MYGQRRNRQSPGLGIGTEYLFKISTGITKYQVVSQLFQQNDTHIQSFLYPDLKNMTICVVLLAANHQKGSSI